MTPFTGEFLGTAVLILLGDGVVANVVLAKTKGNNGGLIAITFGWAVAVFAGVFVATGLGSPAHLNPAVTVGLACAGKFAWADVPMFLLAQLLGAMAGAFLVWIVYKQHFDETTDKDLKLGTFCTGPSIRNAWFNCTSEIIGTFVLLLGVFYITKANGGLGSLDGLPIALLVLGIGLSLGGPTGYAINPARDLGPRIMHFILPIKDKRDSDWAYSWIPVIAPLIGAALAAVLVGALQ
jgi:glycerol uptake facilitator protein